ncbi:LPXTG cell wall anchor domain-containing protein, partial [Curtobacterium sp. CT11-45]|uniref:LPXTG cell wall anchor domain-containing protein n=1 Tax=Curtobacterium sp. CT11-45 TaxID=3243037 RepID=UPI0039AF3822
PPTIFFTTPPPPTPLRFASGGLVFFKNTPAAPTGVAPAVVQAAVRTVAASSSQPALAYTGASSPVVPAGIALLLLLAGAGTLVLRKRH